MPKTRRKRWTRRSEVEIRGLLEDLTASGLSQRAFAEERGIPLSTLTWWRKKLDRDGRKPRRRKEPDLPALVPIVISPEQGSATSFGGRPAGFEVELRSGHLVRVPPGFDADGLRRVLSVLVEVC